ncbi:cobyrinate a,c-diamide synthase [Salipaludibacillus sp. CUR1]|uniref:cobyrinate a,c-diamide synthase n=1 Tax=Salipaludibacillus sp. CUR1 TaxID=2820003 RepID=UPI001E62E364|nr:cobyrinate a,c-diamide synthase [Salipaludibacillus sp. CUR1]MCE7791601.1 cobyrinate a,c-diamide synthase [Salipaludibacillus sp. CUR1]
MSDRRLVIAGTGSGAGKTTLTIGLMAAFKQKGYTVQGFKCGPDYIDPSYHTAVTGRKSRNLDSWMQGRNVLKEVLAYGSKGADISIIEGVMGLYDGKDPASDEGSTADISVITDTPVILVVDCSAMARSAAAIVHGFQTFNRQVNVAGVIANRTGSEGHYKLVKQAIEQECGVPVVGYLNKDDQLTMPERHLGLIPSVERGELNTYFEELGHTVSETVDVNRLYAVAETAPVPEAGPGLFDRKREPVITLAVARDTAFNFYYEENLELLEAYGAELVYFSPVAGEELPEGVHGLYIGGGFPEIFAKELSGQEGVKASVREAIHKGMPVFAECGGYMFLSRSIKTVNGEEYEMAGVIPGTMAMTGRLQALGYREAAGCSGNFLLSSGETVKGHEFHYSAYSPDNPLDTAFRSVGRGGTHLEGVLMKNVVAGYTHLYFPSNPAVPERFINKCAEWKTYG